MDKLGPRYKGVLPALRKIWAEEGFWCTHHVLPLGLALTTHRLWESAWR
jgi:hypothetical protein